MAIEESKMVACCLAQYFQLVGDKEVQPHPEMEEMAHWDRSLQFQILSTLWQSCIP